MCDLVHFAAVCWLQLYVGRRTRYICNFAIKTEPICQIQCPRHCTAVLPLLSNEHALKSGTFGVPGLVLLGRGTTRHKSGTSREIRDGWQPHTHVPLLRSSKIWYRSGALMFCRKVTVSLALRWPCVTDFSGLSTHGFVHGLTKGDEHPAFNHMGYTV